MPEELNVPEIEVEATIRAAGDSEDLVRRLVVEGEHTQEIHDTIKRNTDHLGIVLGKDEVKESNSSRLVGFQEAVQLGTDFIAAAE